MEAYYWSYNGVEIKPNRPWMSAKGQHTRHWNDWSDEKKISEGMTQIKRVTFDDDYNPDLYTLEYGEIENNETRQRPVPLAVDIVRQRFNAKLDYLETQHETGRIDIGGLIVPLSERTFRRLAMGKRKPKEGRELRIGTDTKTFTVAEVDAIDAYIVAHLDKVDKNASRLQKEINAAEVFSDFEAIDLESGWPEIVSPVEVSTGLFRS